MTAATVLTAATLLPVFAPTPAVHADDLDIVPATGGADRAITVIGGCRADDREVVIGGAAKGTGEVTDGWFSVRAWVVRERPGSYRVKARCSGSGFTQEGLVSVEAPEYETTEPPGWTRTGARERGPAWSATERRDRARGAWSRVLAWTLIGVGVLLWATVMLVHRRDENADT
ncbi:hypothetical protein GCM10010191_51980 [Actinomadura vinacea]|uniref:Secreted protein n=1 Tax=Actinomadura vinacea TaxID=115336 RepID=A0ABN3JJF8_9ACTN